MSTAHSRILLTGFEPFNGSLVNPSREVVRRIADQRADDDRIHTRILEVVVDRAPVQLLEAVAEVRPAVVLSLGESGQAGAIMLEQVAMNHLAVSRPDNAGNTVAPRPIDDAGPFALATTIDIDPLIQALLEHGIPAGTSRDMGTHVCNLNTYSMLRACAAMDEPPQVGFVHVPMLPDQVAQRVASGDPARQRLCPSMQLDTQVRALSIIVDGILDSLQ